MLMDINLPGDKRLGNSSRQPQSKNIPVIDCLRTVTISSGFGRLRRLRHQTHRRPRLLEKIENSEEDEIKGRSPSPFLKTVGIQHADFAPRILCTPMVIGYKAKCVSDEPKLRKDSTAFRILQKKFAPVGTQLLGRENVISIQLNHR